MKHLRANTEVIVTIGPAVDSTNGVTPETGVTLGAADQAELLKHGSDTVVDISGATWAAITDCDGYYSLTITTALSDTEGMVDVIIQDESVCLPLKGEFMVLSEAAYDSLYVAKDVGFMDVNIKSIGRADAQETEADNLESACANYSVTRGLTGTSVPAAVAAAAGGIPLSTAGSLEMDTLADWVNGARLDLILDIIAAGTTTDIPALIATAQSDLDTITGASGVVIQDGTIIAASLGADCITAAKIADDAISAEHLNTGVLTADAFAADAIVAATLATGALTADAFAADALVAATFATGAFTADAFAANALVAATFNADCITAAKVAADVHAEGATAVWAESNSALTKAYSLIMEQIYQFLHNDLIITDATGAFALRTLANDGDMASWGVTDNDTLTTRTDVVWV